MDHRVSMERAALDERVQSLYRDIEVPFDAGAFKGRLMVKIAAAEGARTKAPARWIRQDRAASRSGRRSRPRRRPGLSFALACVVLAAVGFGIYAVVDHAGSDRTVVLFTDTTTAGATTTAGSGTIGRPVTTAPGSATTTAAAGPAASTPEGWLSQQRERYDRAHERAVANLALVDFYGPPDPEADLAESELAVAGRVVAVDPLRWNTPDGRQPQSGPVITSGDGSEYMAVAYSTFYIVPYEILKGESRFGTGTTVVVMSRVLNGAQTGPVETGDEVIVMLRYEPRPEGTLVDQGYFLTDWDRSIYMAVGGDFVNIFDPRVLINPESVKEWAAAQQARGPTGIEPELVSPVRTIDDVVAEIPQGEPYSAPVDNIPADLQAEFQAAGPGEELLYVGAGNRDGEMNAVLHTKNFHGMYAEESWGVDFDFFGASKAKFGPTKYPEAAVGEFVDVITIPDSLDFYLRLRDPVAGTEFYARMIVSGEEAQDYEYGDVHLRVFNLGADEQIGGDQDPGIRQFLEDHSLSDLIRPGDIVRVDFSAIHWAGTDRWRIHVDGRGVQVVNALTVERLAGATELLRLARGLTGSDSGEAGG